MEKWLSTNGRRIFLNLIFLVIWFMTALSNSQYCLPTTPRSSLLNHIVLYNLGYAALLYINTLVWVPLFFIRKKYKTYAIVLLAHVLVFAVGMSEYMNWLMEHYKVGDSVCFAPIVFGHKGASSWMAYYTNTALIFLCCSLAFLFSYLAQQYFVMNRLKEQALQQQKEIELSLLQSQINPHFFFNVLNSIYALSLKKSDATPDVVLKLSDIMRYMLYETKQKWVPLEKEIQLIQDYLDIEKIRIGQNAALYFDSKSLLEDYTIAPALLIPFVENAIKHGTDSLLKNAYVKVQIYMEEDIMHFFCENNYKPKRNEAPGGIGLRNVQKRLELLYPKLHQLLVHNEEGKFSVHLKMTLKK